MEIYRNEPTTVKVKAPVEEGLYSVKIKSPEHETTITTVAPAPNIPYTDEKVLNIPIEFQHTWLDGTIELEITVSVGSAQPHTYSEYVDVVTPLFRYTDLDGAYPKEKVPELERLVRKVIEAFTGQYFGKRKARHVVSSTNPINYFGVPIIEFTGMSDRYMTNTTTLNPPKYSYEFVNDNYGLSIAWPDDLYDVKTDSWWILGRRLRYHEAVIEGYFGYNKVPQDVKEAALLIAGLWGCNQTLWRDRYIQTMRSSDWSIQYNPSTFERSTGSVTADNLLSKYSSRGFSPELI